MKKIILLLITVTLLLFTGCDAILNSAYPTYDPENTEFSFGKNVINVILDVDTTTINIYGAPIKVALIPIRNGQLSIGDSYINDNYNQASISSYFDYLPNEVYRIFAFHDENYDGIPNFDEPSVELFNQDYGSYLFDLSYENDITLYTYGYLSDYTRISEAWLAQLNPDYDNSNYVNANFYIDGPNLISPDGGGYYYRLIPDDPDSYIVGSGEYVSADITVYNGFYDITSTAYFTDIENGDFYVYFDYYDIYAGDQLEIEVAVEIYKGGDYHYAYNTYYVDVENYTFDPYFWLDFYANGYYTYYLYKDLDYLDTVTLEIYSNSSDDIESIEWWIKDSYGYYIAYNGSDVNYGTSTNININLGNMEYLLNESWWSSDPYLTFYVRLNYYNGVSETNSMSISLYNYN